MKKLSLFLLLFTAILTAQSDVYFTSYPSLSPDGSKIIFSFNGDLWSVSNYGGQASRITAMLGNETDALYSPDGKWIAFTGREDGNSNVYLMPVGGGEIKQLTYYDRSDHVSSWSWDSKYIYFTSNRYNRMSTYKVSVKGGTPERLFENYFNWPHNLSVNPKTGEYFFNESWESSIFTNRKQYKGAFNPDIKSYNSRTKEFKKHTTWQGKDFWPTIDKNGKIYFVSDQANNEYNLYIFANGNKKQLTSFNHSIKNPRVSANGNYVVFEKGYQVFIYNAATGKTKKVNISLPINKTLDRKKAFNVRGKITSFSVSPDNKKIAFVSRGELFISDTKGEFIKQLKTLPTGRVVETMWLDSVNVIFNQTVGGWLNWFTIKADGSGKEKQITFDERNNRDLTFNSDKTKGVYLSGRDEMRLMNLKSFENSVIVKDEFWAMDNSTPYFSPDNKYILYTVYRNFEMEIFVYDVNKKNKINITNTGVSEGDPYWSPDGKYIYFESDRFHPAYPYGFTNSNIYRISLRKFTDAFKSNKFEDLFTNKKKDKSNKNAVVIDFKNIAERWEKITSANGNQFLMSVVKNKDITNVLYTSNPDGKGNALFKTTIKPFTKNKTKKISSGKGFQFVKVKKNYYMLSGGTINTLNIKQSKLKKIKMNFTFYRDLRNEFKNMFYETWANLDENYYDSKFHGVDWKKMMEKYAAFLPFINSRTDLRSLLSDLQGELNSSHQGFYSNGKEEKTFYRSRTSVTGIIFNKDNPYKVKRVVADSPTDKVDVNVRNGDVLFAVNGNKINKNNNREFYFSNPTIEKEITLTFSRNGQTFDTKIHPENSRALSTQLYNEWIENNKEYVDKASGNKIGYIYMKNMGKSSLKKFMIDMTTTAFNKKGLILDLRYNTGGNVHDEVLGFLSRRPYLSWKYREGKLTIQPNFPLSANPIVLLMNEQTLSDGEMTSAGFKALKLGKLIGTETYRWIIFTSGKSLVDGSFYRLPSWGCYTLDGKDLEHTGVAPDIFVKTNFKDRLSGNDPQLKRAVEEIKKEWKK